MKTVAVLNDLFFAANLRVAASKLRINLVIVKDKKDFIKELENTNKIIIDLEFDKFDIFDVLKGVNDDIYIIGYSDNKELSIMADKYCDLILPKKEFSRRLTEMLK